MRNQKRKLPLQMVLQSQSWGGVRQGAGRPKLKKTKVGHKKWPEFKKLTPVHITMRLHKDLPNLRSKVGFKIFKSAVLGAREKGLQLIHFAILGNHFHVLLEASSNQDLACAMRSLNGRLSRAINKWIGQRRGGVFTERYHLQLLRSPTLVKRAMVYLFSNASKHFGRKHISGAYCSYLVFAGKLKIDRTSKHYGKDWRQPQLTKTEKDGYLELLVPPQSWLLSEGWRLVA